MKRCMPVQVMMALLLSLFAEGARAQQGCSDVLVMATTNKTVLSIQNLAIAWSVTEGQWDTLQHNLGVNAVIYGIPIGATYGDFQNNVRTMAAAYNITDFQQYSETYASSELDPNSVEAYKYCLASQFGLAIFVYHIGTTADSSYGIWIVNTPFPNGQQTVVGQINTLDNFNTDSTKLLHDVIDKQNFALGLNRQLVVNPQDPTKPATLTVSVGTSYSRTLILPPLVVPKAVTDVHDYSPPVSVCAGYCGGNCINHRSVQQCYHPIHKGAVFVPGTERVVKTVTGCCDATIYSKDSGSICISAIADNTSGCINSSSVSAYITASETYPSDTRIPLHFEENPPRK